MVYIYLFIWVDFQDHYIYIYIDVPWVVIFPMGNISGNPRNTSNYLGYLWRDNGLTIVNIYPRRSAWILNTLNDLTFLLDQPLFLTGSYCGKPLALTPCWFGSPSGMENLAVSCFFFGCFVPQMPPLSSDGLKVDEQSWLIRGLSCLYCPTI